MRIGQPQQKLSPSITNDECNYLAGYPFFFKKDKMLLPLSLNTMNTVWFWVKKQLKTNDLFQGIQWNEPMVKNQTKAELLKEMKFWIDSQYSIIVSNEHDNTTIFFSQKVVGAQRGPFVSCQYISAWILSISMTHAHKMN